MSLDDATLNRLRSSVWPALESGWGLPRGILGAIATWETRGTFRDEVSRAGARGIFQLTPSALTQVRNEFGIIANPSDPYASSVAAAALLSRYMRLFSGEITLAVAAYNWGEGSVRRFVRQVVNTGRGFMPRETREYIANVLPMIQGR
jgi:soluble lytic murein transglycosylase-like protein